MKAKIVDNLMDKIDSFFKGKEGHRTDPGFIALCDQIAGKEVELVFQGGDAFEFIDQNYWLPKCCWTEIKEGE